MMLTGCPLLSSRRFSLIRYFIIARSIFSLVCTDREPGTGYFQEGNIFDQVPVLSVLAEQTGEIGLDIQYTTQSTLSKTDTFGNGTKYPSDRDVRLLESQIKGSKKGRGQLWVSVLPRCLLRESQLYSLFFNYKIIVAVQISCPAPAHIPSDILVGNCRTANCRS